MFNFQNFFIRRTLNKRLNEIERRARRKATAEARKKHAQAQAEGRILLRKMAEENGISYRTAYAHAREINDLRTVGRLEDAKKLLAKYFPNSVKPKRFTISSFLFG
jgi:vacuolar-type H+-ATPase subunit E/Vma4